MKAQFAQNLNNLTLASPSINRHQKSDKDFAEWVPDENVCWFAATIVHVKAKYGLSIDTREAVALLIALSKCVSTPEPDVEAIWRSSANTEATAAEPSAQEPASQTVTQDALALYDDNGNGRITRAEARNHAIAPVRRGYPAYPHMNDPDGDGTVCE